MDPAQSWGRLASALIGPYEREIVGALVGAYQSLEGRIEVATSGRWTMAAPSRCNGCCCFVMNWAVN